MKCIFSFQEQSHHQQQQDQMGISIRDGLSPGLLGLLEPGCTLYTHSDTGL